MESYLNENFGGVKPKHSSHEALGRWRKVVGVVKNPKRRFRFTANLGKRSEAAAMKRTNQEKLRVAVLVSKAALQFIHGLAPQSEYTVPAAVKAAGYGICAEELSSVVESHDIKKLKAHGGTEGLLSKVSTSESDGVSTSKDKLASRQEIFGINKFAETEARSFWVFVWEALQDMTLMILAACAFFSLVVGIATEGWPKGAHDGLGIVASILLVVFVTATSDYRQSLQFKDLDKEKKKITVQVTRSGYRQKLSIYELLVGDIVHLSIGDQVPADGLFVSGFSLLINESSLTGESEPVAVNAENPFLLSGTKVQDGSCKMLVTTVGMRTQWGKLMATLSEGGDDETPLQVKLNGVATIIGKIGLVFAVVTFAVLTESLFRRKIMDGSYLSWSGDDALELLEFFAIAVTIVVVAVPEGLPLAVTLSLAFAMKKMMNDKALVRHLAACETMGSATSICSDKTGTLTTNHMTVVKACICGKIKEVDKSSNTKSLFSELPDSVMTMLSQSIFNNTGGDVVINQDGKREILGTPTETAILELGLSLGGDFQAVRKATTLLKVEPFNSAKKRMGVVIQLPGGAFRAHCKGASEIILASCSKYLNDQGNAVPLDSATIAHLNATIESFANEALRTLCLAYIEVAQGFSANDAIPEEGYTCIGIVGIKDPVRPGVKESVAICRSAGITVRMVTGDNFSTIVTVAKWGRSVYINIQKFVQFQLTVNVVALVVNFSSACLTGSAPLTAVQLLWVNMIMDTLGALALATEPPNDELMKRTPVGRKGNFISNIMWRNIMGQAIYQFFVIWYLQTEGKTLFELKGDNSDLVLNTLIFNCFVFCQVFNEVSSREMERINVFKGILDNNVFVAVLGSTVVFQIIIVQFLGDFANTTPLSLREWFSCIVIGFIGMPIAAIVKLFPVGSQ
ncbi:hypothetical protein VPH35_064662 [Triticum aestivum]|uniref:Calcium-transporting ATPase n=2 Tax=Triticum TaxID=4564 RepID=A0A9R0S7F4_TRITD|nr:unnamed protein product [Triticum turgidum subsp. durum]